MADWASSATFPPKLPAKAFRTPLIAATWSLHKAAVRRRLHQQGLDTTMPAGRAMFQMLGVFAEFERSIIQERVRAGLRRAVSEDKQLGRPRIAADIEARILGSKGSQGYRRQRPQDRSALRRRSEYGAAHQPPFRRKRHGLARRGRSPRL